MDEHNSSLICNALKALHINDITRITGTSKTLVLKLLTQYIPSTTLYRMLTYHSMYQILLDKLNTSATKLAYMQCSYWQELCFIWQNFMAVKSPYHGECYGDLDFVKKFYLCHLRSLQELLILYPELDSKTCQQIKFHLKKLNNIISNNV